MLRGLVAVCLTLTYGGCFAGACPPSGARFIIKGFTGDTPVSATGGQSGPRGQCKFLVEGGGYRELWWVPGADVVPAVDVPPRQGRGVKAGAALAAGAVYECTLPGVGMFTAAYFGIVDGSTYRDFDGRRGRYAFDASTGVLHLVSGSSAGLRYKRMPEGNFRVLGRNGDITGGNCVHNNAKRIDGRW